MSEITRMVALDIGGTKIASALVCFEEGASPRVEAYASIPTEAAMGGVHVLERAVASVKRVIEGVSDPVCGIGVSSAGVIDPVSGDVTYANDLMPGWGGTHLGSTLTETFGVPCRVLNDVHAHALGEARWGAGIDAKSCLVVAVGTGIGGAFVEDGHIMLGAHNEAGHIGHMSVSDAQGTVCSCGAQAHLEPIAAGPGIKEMYLSLGESAVTPEGEDVEGAYINSQALLGNASAIAAQTRSGHAIGEVLGSVCNLLDPTCIILSGSVAQSGKVWHDAMHKGWQEAVMPPCAATPIVQGALGGDAPLIGAAEHVRASAYVS